MKERTANGEYSAMFTLIKEAAMVAKRDLDAENRRFMTVHGQVNNLNDFYIVVNRLVDTILMHSLALSNTQSLTPTP